MFDLNPAYFVFAPHAIAAVIVVALVITLMRMFRYLAWEYVPAKFAIMKTYTTEAEDPTGSRKRILLVLGVLLVVGVFTALYELVQTIGFHPGQSFTLSPSPRLHPGRPSVWLSAGICGRGFSLQSKRSGRSRCSLLI